MRAWNSVYVIAGSHGLVKIGVSGDPIARLADLQTGSGHHLHLAHSTTLHGDAYAAEAEAHGLLAKYRQSGEWFAVPVDVAVAAVSAAAFRHSRQIEPIEREPRWWLRFAILTAIAAPVWTFPTPAPFLIVAFSVLIWVQVRLRRYRGPFTWPLTLRWAGISACAIAASLVLAMPFAKAEGLAMPDYDHTKYCESISAFMKNNQAILDGCNNNESLSRTNLHRVWGETPVDVKQACISMVEMGSVGSYQGLSGCISLMVGKLWMDGKLKLKP